MKASNPRFLEHDNHKQVLPLLQYQIRVFANDENTKNTKKLTFGNVSNQTEFLPLLYYDRYLFLFQSLRFFAVILNSAQALSSTIADDTSWTTFCFIFDTRSVNKKKKTLCSVLLYSKDGKGYFRDS